MKTLTAVLVAMLAIAALLTPPPVAFAGSGHAAPWRWTSTWANHAVPAGTWYDLSLTCPAGYRPVSWSFEPTDWDAAASLTVQAETVNFDTNSGLLRVYNGTDHSDSIYGDLHCVNGADVGPVTTQSKVYTHTIYNSGGFLQCAIGTAMLAGSASWDVTGSAVRLDFSSPTSSGWYATGSAALFAGHLTLQVHCISAAVAAGLHLVQHAYAPNRDVSGPVGASTWCSPGERLANAGGFEHPNDSSVDPTQALGSLRRISDYGDGQDPIVFVAATMPNATTTLVAVAICVAASTPSVTITAGPSGLQASPNISFALTASDPAGYQLHLECNLYRSGSQYRYVPCDAGSTSHANALDDGKYKLLVYAENPDGNDGTDSRTFEVDTTAPTVTVDGKPHNPTRATSASFEVIQADPHPGMTFCNLDAGAEQQCPALTAYTDLADGIHIFHWRAVDSLGNEGKGSYRWRIDTTAPTAALVAPSAPFAPDRSATVSWSGSDHGGSGVVTWQLQSQWAPYNGAFGTWSSPVSIPAATSAKTFTELARGSDFCYRVRAVDQAGNVSAYSAPRCTAVLLDDWDLNASPGWVRTSDKAGYAGTTSSTTRRGATLVRTGAQLDRLALLATTCPTCGTVGLYVNGRLVGTVNLHAATTHERQLMALPPFAYRTGTLTLKVLTAGKLVRIDGVGVSRT